jgi:RNA polymerase sigma factor (sigma-70 family)
MAVSQASKVVHSIRTIALHQWDGTTDGNLLDLYARQKDEAAFEALVRRHGRMVLGVCRRILGNGHDAEDAFQATFLVLVRKAATIRPSGMVGNWLYGVAHRTALEARRSIARRRTKEVEVKLRTETPENTLAHLRSLLDQELPRLPDKYRAVLVLCDLEGRTRKEAAQQFGLPEGTIASRLNRARILLAKRLTRHGVRLSGGALAVAMAQVAASASAPHSLVLATANSAAAFAAGPAAAAAVVSKSVAALTEGVLKTILLSKLKVIVLLLVVIAAAGFGAAEVLVGGTELTPNEVGLLAKQGAQQTDKTKKFESAPVEKRESIEEAIPELRNAEALLSQRVLSRVKRPMTFCQGQRFQFPFGPPGAAITFSVDKPENQYVWPPKVDASTPVGRKAIYQSLAEAHKGGHFTMDGNQLLVFGGVRIVPFSLKDERLRKAWYDVITRIPPAQFVQFVKRQHAIAKVTAGPIDGCYVLPLAESSFFAALTSDEQVVVLWITQAPEKFQYNVSHYLLEPAP